MLHRTPPSLYTGAMDLLADARALADDLADLRHRLHRQPELGLALPRTQSTVLSALEGLGLEVTTGTTSTSVVAVLRGGGGPGAPVVLLRGDMDKATVFGTDFFARADFCCSRWVPPSPYFLIRTATFSLGWAPTLSQCLARSPSSLMVAGSVSGSYVPMISMYLPSRGAVASATTIR